MEHLSYGPRNSASDGINRLAEKAISPIAGGELRYMRASPSGIAKKTRAFVLERDRYTCQMCGAVSGEPHQDDVQQRTRIQIGRILAKSMGGGNDASNLRAVCSVCAEGMRNLTLDRPSLQKLLIQLRRATGADQIGVLLWLVRKFPKQTADILEEE